MQRAGLVVAALLAAASAAEAASNPLRGRLTAVELNDCTRLSKHPDGDSYRCPGLPGWPVYVAEGDQRQMLSFGANGAKRQSATQTLGAFNTIFSGKQRPTIEWRVAQAANGRAVPYATIVRYHTSRDGQNGNVLVVTKVDAKVSCRIAVIDALANDDAIVLAREYADSQARQIQCPKEPLVLGKTGKSP